jgi:cysteine desulfurase/selenocysteine lyase
MSDAPPAGAADAFAFLRAPEAAGLAYLDNASTTQMVDAAAAAMADFERTARANVHRGVYARAVEATRRYEAARATIARYFGAADDEILFTGGTTGAINLVAQSFGARLGPGDEVLISAADHHANIVPWQMLAERRGVTLKALPVDGFSGLIALDRLADLVGPRCRLIAVTHASNVTGAATDVAAVVEAARRVGAAVLLDGAQTARHGPRDLPALGIDFYACSGHKCFGPTGIGVLWGRRTLLATMPPVFGGGDMIRRVTLERTTYADPPLRFEAGTPPIAAAIGFAAALQWLSAQDLTAFHTHESQLMNRLVAGLRGIQAVRLLGAPDQRDGVPTVAFDLDGVHPHDVAQVLDGHGVAVRGGHHCAQPLMDALDLAGVTRVSLAPYTSARDIDVCIAAVADAARRLA